GPARCPGRSAGASAPARYRRDPRARRSPRAPRPSPRSGPHPGPGGRAARSADRARAPPTCPWRWPPGSGSVVRAGSPPRRAAPDPSGPAAWSPGPAPPPGRARPAGAFRLRDRDPRRDRGVVRSPWRTVPFLVPGLLYALAQPRPRAGRRGSEQHQVVAVDQLVAAAPAEQRLDLLGAVAADPARVVGVGGGKALGEVAAVRLTHDHRVAPLERALNGDHAGREQAAAAAQGPRRAGIDAQHTHGGERACDPLLARAPGVGAGDEARAGAARGEPGERARLDARRDDHGAAGVGRDARGGELADHAAGAGRAAGAARHRLDLRRDLADHVEADRALVAGGVGG